MARLPLFFFVSPAPLFWRNCVCPWLGGRRSLCMTSLSRKHMPRLVFCRAEEGGGFSRRGYANSLLWRRVAPCFFSHVDFWKNPPSSFFPSPQLKSKGRPSMGTRADTPLIYLFYSTAMPVFFPLKTLADCFFLAALILDISTLDLLQLASIQPVSFPSRSLSLVVLSRRRRMASFLFMQGR